MPSRSPASVASIASKPPLSMAAASVRAPPRITSPRSSLMPLTSPRLEAGFEASSSISSSSVSRSSRKPWTPSGGRSARLIAAAARLRIVPPMPTSRPPPVHHPSRLDLPGHVLAQRLHALGGRLLVGEEALAHADRAERQRLCLVEPPAGEPHGLDAAAADVEGEAVVQRRGVGHRQPAVAGLLAAADHSRLQPGALADSVEQLVAVGRIADRAGCHGLHLRRSRLRGRTTRTPPRCGSRGRCARAAAAARRPCRRRCGPPRGSRPQSSTRGCPARSRRPPAATSSSPGLPRRRAPLRRIIPDRRPPDPCGSKEMPRNSRSRGCERHGTSTRRAHLRPEARQPSCTRRRDRPGGRGCRRGRHPGRRRRAGRARIGDRAAADRP